jgi:hypothetical protein
MCPAMLSISPCQPDQIGDLRLSGVGLVCHSFIRRKMSDSFLFSQPFSSLLRSDTVPGNDKTPVIISQYGAIGFILRAFWAFFSHATACQCLALSERARCCRRNENRPDDHPLGCGGKGRLRKERSAGHETTGRLSRGTASTNYFCASDDGCRGSPFGSPFGPFKGCKCQTIGRQALCLSMPSLRHVPMHT